MPTGSLCAERNVIGSALAADLTLRREDIRYVAVLSLSLEPSTGSLVCGACDPQDAPDDLSGSGNYECPSSPLSLRSAPLTPQGSICSDTLHHSLEELPERPADMRRAMSQPVVASQLSQQSANGNGSSTPNKTRMVTVFDVPKQVLLTPSNQTAERLRSRKASHETPNGSSSAIAPPSAVRPSRSL
jgi:hypothetical protein